MTQILLISNDDVVNALYPLNINLYVGKEIIVRTNLIESQNLLEAKNPPELVIVLIDEAKSVIDFFKSLKNKIPIIVIGKLENEEAPHITFCDSDNKLQEVTKAVAKNYNITAKIMSEKKTPEYYPITVKMLTKLSKVSTEIYICDGELKPKSLFIQIADKGDIIEKVLKVCKVHDAETVYVETNERFKIVRELTENLKLELEDANLKQNKKLALHEQGFELIGNHIEDLKGLNEEILFLHKTCIETSKEIIKKIPGLKSLLDDLMSNKSSIVYTHSILISFVCTHMVKHLPWGGQSHAEKLAYIAFYHDLFLIPIYRTYPKITNDEDFLKIKGISDNDYETVLTHAKLIGEVISKFPRSPIGADAIIRQHHGEFQGTGFAKEFKEDISPLAKVFIIAEAFVMEILKDQASVAHGKLTFSKFTKGIVIEKLKAKFSRSSYKKIVETIDKVPI